MSRQRSVAIAPPAAKPLSPTQKKFNTLVQRIATQREQLAAWELAVPLYRERRSSEFMPLLNKYRGLNVDLVQLLDAAAARKGLTKTERAALHDVIASMAADLADSAQDDDEREAMKDLYRHHGGGDFDAEQADVHAHLKAMARDVFGVELDDDVDLESPEELLERVGEQVRAAQRQAAEQHERDQAGRVPKKPSARERKEQEQAQLASQSLREIYRKLASTLHPDRETDPAERARKTALMQRVNQAYAQNKLLDLLQLQLEVEQIDPAHIDNLSEERLKHYNRVLAEQLAELKHETQTAESHFCMEFGLDPGARLKPATLMTHLRSQLQHLTLDIDELSHQLDALQDPAILKRWLREQHAAMREAQMFPDDLLGLFGR